MSFLAAAAFTSAAVAHIILCLESIVQQHDGKKPFLRQLSKHGRGYTVSLVSNPKDNRGYPDMPSFPYTDGYYTPYPPFMHPQIVHELQRQHELGVDDIVIATYPKCGE